jgi:hypothetical protein
MPKWYGLQGLIIIIITVCQGTVPCVAALNDVLAALAASLRVAHGWLADECNR